MQQQTQQQQQQQLALFAVLCCLLKLSQEQHQGLARGVRKAVAVTAHTTLWSAAAAAAAAAAADPPPAAEGACSATGIAAVAAGACSSSSTGPLVLPWVVLLGPCCLAWGSELELEAERVLTVEAKAEAIHWHAPAYYGDTPSWERDAIMWCRAPLRRLVQSLDKNLFSSSSSSGGSSGGSSSSSGAAFGWLRCAAVAEQLEAEGVSAAAVQQQVHAAALSTEQG
jgi:uncharacterized membrane protein YgcG